jgi:hypothetical protein
MAGGFDVQAVHLTTASEALVTMTAGAVDEMFWKVV